MNSLLQDTLLRTGHINHAAIIRIKDGAVKAQSTHIQIPPNYDETIKYAFDHPRHARAPGNEFNLMGLSYQTVRVDHLSIYAKNNKNGLIIAKTKGHYILGTYDTGMMASIAVEAIEKLGNSYNALIPAEYLRKQDK